MSKKEGARYRPDPAWHDTTFLPPETLLNVFTTYLPT